MPPTDLDAIKARLAAATPGPWRHLGQGYIVHPGTEYDGCGVPDRSTRIPLRDADADLIAHAPDDLAALLAELRATTADLAIAVEVARERGEEVTDLRGGIEALRDEWRTQGQSNYVASNIGPDGSASRIINAANAVTDAEHADALDALLRERAR